MSVQMEPTPHSHILHCTNRTRMDCVDVNTRNTGDQNNNAKLF